MSDRWISESERLLKKMKELSSKEKPDRLEIVNSILFNLDLLDRSLHGWRLWVRNLSLMAQFSAEELEEIEETLEKQIETFIEYDIEASKKWKEKFPQIRIVRRRERTVEDGHGMYV